MNTIEYYLELRFAFQTVSNNTSITVSTNQLSKILHCSIRNTRIILKKMHSEGFIEWTSGKGRGNQSDLIFKLPLSSVIILHFQSLIQQNKLDEAIGFLDRKEIPIDIKKKCYNQLRPNFGLQIPTDTERVTEQNLSNTHKKMTLNHMVRQVNNRTSSWMIGKKMTKKTMFQWPSQSRDSDF